MDLVFGYKQRPPHMPNGSEDAVAACNVYRFYHYPDAYSMDEVRSFYRFYHYPDAYSMDEVRPSRAWTELC